jgi:glyoxalase family protein
VEQKQIKDYLEGLGYTDVSEQKNRNYFHSIYFRMPGGVLFEVATCDIGFFIDEPRNELGQHLQFPPWFDDRRDEYLAQLEPITA